MTTIKELGKVFLAPMAGITDSAFRQICSQFGAGLVYSEMVSAKGLHFNSELTNCLLKFDEIERPLAVQLFGSDSKILAETARKCTNFDIIDINMGCPAPKIVKNGEGAALMKNPALIGEIVKSVSHAVDIPVTVKIRKGFDDSSVNAVEIAKIAQEAGAAAIAVHGRTRAQMFSGNADWEIIARVKEAVNIPVIGNGDIDCAEKAQKMFEETNCDAIMIGRAAEGNPWIFKQIADYLPGNAVYFPSVDEKIYTALKHLELSIKHKGDYVGVLEMRRQLGKYIRGLTGATEARVRINSATTVDEVKRVLTSFLER